MADKVRVYRDLAPLVRAATIAIWAQIGCDGLSLLVTALKLPDRAAENDMLAAGVIALVGLAALIVTLIAAVFVLRSIYRASNNLHAAGVNGLEFTPGWCVGWFFIPIACLWKPYQAMKEIWTSSADPLQFSVDRSVLLPIWWALFLASNITGTSSARVALFDHGADAQAMADMLSTVSTIITIPEAVILLILLKQIVAAQERNIHYGNLAETFS